jgi:acetylornithine deacetylase/succinyl-diaminopimelate desuccinylase-like protein
MRRGDEPHGSRALAREERFDFVIVGEPTGLDVVYTHKGSCIFSTSARGAALRMGASGTSA